MTAQAPSITPHKIAVLGTGNVGKALATRLVELGHFVRMGSRTADNPAAAQWVAAQQSGRASQGSFADAAAYGDIVLNATAGSATLAVLEAAGSANLAGKVLIDVANPLDFSKGMPPTLFIGNSDSLGEAVQRQFPQARVVKALNTMNADVMAHPERVHGEHDVFVCGDDAAAKATVVELLQGMGWRSPIDLGGIKSARGTEALLLPWLALWQALGHLNFNFHIAGRG